MNQEISVVIIARNEEARLSRCVKSAFLISHDVLVIDNDSSDSTPQLAQSLGARYFNNPWKGFSAQKNFGNLQAKNSWIFSLDADEEISENLAKELNALQLTNPEDFYKVNRLNFLGQKPIRFGEWNPDWQVRLFNRDRIHWNEEQAVHETLVIPETSKGHKLGSRLLHYTSPTVEHYAQKMEKYALLYAEKRKVAGKKSSLWKPYISAGFGFIREYIIKLGFLDGQAGLQLARMHAKYTFNKYL